MDVTVQTQQRIQEKGEPPRKRKNTCDLKECFICKKTCSLERMRVHVGQHIIRMETYGSKICGYCGRGCCNTFLERTHKKKGEWFYKPNSNCPYFVILARKPTHANKVNLCTNYIEHCKICSECVWKYNMGYHYSEMHKEYEKVPWITDEEKKVMLAVKYK